MANKKVSKAKTVKKNTPIDNKKFIRNGLFVCIVILIVYKCILISIVNRASDVDDYLKSRKVTDYASEIVINQTKINDTVYFEDIYMENNFKELIPKSYIQEYPTKTYINEDKTVFVSFHKAPTMIEDLNTDGVEKYLKASNIKDDDDIMDFILTYNRTHMDIFDSFNDIRNELFKRNYYIIVYRAFDEVHKVTGDLNGRVLISGNHIEYELYNDNDMYQVIFVGYDLDSTIEIVSSIHFKEAK